MFKIEVQINGAVDRKNLEPAPFISILDELEQWEAYLKAEPEVIHKLQAFEQAARDTGSELKPVKLVLRRQGPSR